MRLCIHYGFGDYVICYGMVKELALRHDEIMLFAIQHRSPRHIDNIKRLYANIPNVKISIEDPKAYSDTVYIGWDKLTEAVGRGYKRPFPYFFYEQAGVPISKMWDNFVYVRDTAREKEVFYNVLGLHEGEVYDILHDDPFRGFVVKSKYIDPAVRTIHLMDYEGVSILDTLYLVERCRRLDTFTTGLVPFIDLMGIEHDGLYLHQYIRPLAYDQPILNLHWNIIK